MNRLFQSATAGYAVFTTFYFSILFLASQLKLQTSHDFYDTMASSINVSMDIFYYTGLFWCAMLGLSSAGIVYNTVKNHRIKLDVHSIMFLLSTGLIVLQYCCSHTDPLAYA